MYQDTELLSRLHTTLQSHRDYNEPKLVHSSIEVVVPEDVTKEEVDKLIEVVHNILLNTEGKLIRYKLYIEDPTLIVISMIMSVPEKQTGE